MFYRNISCFTLLACLCCFTYAQDSYLLLEKSKSCRRLGQKIQSNTILSTLLSLSSSQDDHQLHAKLLTEKAEWFHYYLQMDSAEVYALKALEYVEKYKVNDLLPCVLLQNGVLSMKLGKFEAALSYLERAKSTAESHNQLGIVYISEALITDSFERYYWGMTDVFDVDKVLPGYQRAINHSLKQGDTIAYTALLARYIDLYKDVEEPLELNNLLDKYEEVLAHFPNIRYETNFFLLKAQGAVKAKEFSEAFTLLNAAIVNTQKMDIPFYTQHCYVQLYDAYFQAEKYEEAVQALDSARAVADTNHIAYGGHDMYYEAYHQLGKSDLAMAHVQLWKKAFTEDAMREKMDAITEWETKYGTKEKEIELKEQATQKKILIEVITLISIIGILLGVISFMRHQSNVKLQEQNQIIISQATELQKLDKLKSDFFANISHELKTPLTLILGPSNRMINRVSKNHEFYNSLQIIDRNAKKLDKMINDILKLARIDEGKLELEKETIDLYPFIFNIVENFRFLTEEKEIDFSLVFDGRKNLKVEVDKSKVETVIINLLSNSFKFTTEGGIVKLRIASNNGYISIEVEDNGRGIYTEDLPYIFDRFYQTKQVKQNIPSGTGIGLALCKELVHLMKGEIRVESKLGEGTTFYAKIPCEILTEDSPKREVVSTPLLANDPMRVSERIAPAHENDRRVSILLVEDDRDLQSFIEILLTPYYRLIKVQNGVQALDYLQNHESVRLIISDLMMPRMNGMELVEILKSSKEFCHIPTIMLTVKSKMDTRMKALRVGVDDYITKPFEEKQLLASIKNILRDEHKETLNISSNDQPTKVSHADLKWLAKVERITQEKMGNSAYSISQMAYDLDVSRQHLNRMMKKITGMTASAYLKELRLSTARTMLETQQSDSIKAVAYEVGFSNISYFSQAFKKRFGKLPSEYS